MSRAWAGLAVSAGALIFGGVGFWVQEKMMEGHRAQREEHISKEVARRVRASRQIALDGNDVDASGQQQRSERARVD